MNTMEMNEWSEFTKILAHEALQVLHVHDGVGQEEWVGLMSYV